nr:MAG TPA: hypothetical protein [Caudoviricetes sp.]
MKTIKVYSYDELNKSAKASAYKTMAADHDFMIKQELFPNVRTRRVNVSCNAHAYDSGMNDGHSAMSVPTIE